jgi:hypothetical protein
MNCSLHKKSLRLLGCPGQRGIVSQAVGYFRLLAASDAGVTLRPPLSQSEDKTARSRSGSVLIIVLWIALALVCLTLYFADSMNYELRASDNRVAGEAATQAVEGAARYISAVLSAQGTNGGMPDLTLYQYEAVKVGDARFWLISRETNTVSGPTSIRFGLVDEASRLNLNYATSNQLYYLPRMTLDLCSAIQDWRDTNGTGSTVTYYAMQDPAYQCKCAPFETVDEVRLVYGADMDTLVGEDFNRNGILDENETDENQNGKQDPGILDYLTVYSRESNTNSSGTG